jgi:DNA invertase Pin-like site-specific DNA recombinase
MKAAIYVRVSTKEQSYEQQVEPCVKMCQLKGWEYDIFKEVESSIKYREVFEDVKKRARLGEYQAIVVFRLDRAWRSSRMFIMDFDDLNARGVKIVSVMEGIDPTTTMGEFVAKVFVSLAELERKLISEATKQRLEALRNLGVKLGRPKGSKDKVQKARPKSGYQQAWVKRRKNK